MPVTNSDDGTEMPAAGDAFDPIAQLTNYQGGAAKYHAVRIYADATAREADTYAADGWIAYTEDTDQFWGRRDGTYGLLSRPVTVRKVARNANQSIANGTTPVVIQWDVTTGLPDVGGITYSAGDYALVAPETGVYRIGGMASWATSSGGNRSLGYEINGVRTSLDTRDGIATHFSLAAATDILRLTAGDKVALSAWQTSGGSLNCNAAALTLEMLAAD